MKITKLFVYPIKSCRGYEPTSAELTRHGFTHDRRFMLLEVQQSGTLKNMHVAHYPDLTLIFATINHAADKITVTYRPPKTTNKQERSLDIPLNPEIHHLSDINVEMHKSPTQAFDMGHHFNDWFSECLGYRVVLAYLGPNYRPVLMSTINNPTPSSSTTSHPSSSSSSSPTSWLSPLTSRLPVSISGVLGTNSTQPTSSSRDQITFADCAPYLIVSEASLADVSARLPSGEEMDISKFRPNIIVSGSSLTAWEEDLWAELSIFPAASSSSSSTSPSFKSPSSSSPSSSSPSSSSAAVDAVDAKSSHPKAIMFCVQNCARCASINIDYATGKPGTAEQGKVLKLLQKDRRIDKGMKYSPVFGRYSFIDESGEGVSIAVGDEVVVTKRNEGYTTFDWAGLATTS